MKRPVVIIRFHESILDVMRGTYEIRISNISILSYHHWNDLSYSLPLISLLAKIKICSLHIPLFQSVVNAYAFTDLAGADGVHFIISRIVTQLFTKCADHLWHHLFNYILVNSVQQVYTELVDSNLLINNLGL